MFCIRSWKSLLLPGILAIASLLVPSGNAQEIDSQIQEHFFAAQRYQEQGLLDAAAHEYEVILLAKKGMPEVYANLGLVYYAQSRFEDSARMFAAAGKLKPGMHGVSLWLGINYVRLHRPAEGTSLLREAVRLDPGDKLAQSWLGTALWDAGHVDAALLQLRITSTKFHDDPDLLFVMGEAYGKAANEEIEELLAESSGAALSDIIYARIYDDEHDLPKSERHFRRAIERNLRSLEGHLGLGELLLRQGLLSSAQEQFEAAGTLDPRSAAALARSGELLLLLDHSPEGLLRIGRALQIDRAEALDAMGLPVEDQIDGHPLTDEMLLLCRAAAEKLERSAAFSSSKFAALAALSALEGDKEAARAAFQKIGLTQSGPRPPESLFAEAMTYFHERRYGSAETTLLRWLTIHPGDRTARYNLALVRRQTSLEDLAQLLTIAPSSYHVHQMLGQLYVRREEDGKALAEYLAVAAERPDLAGIHFWLGHLYWKQGDAENARSEFEQELKIDPGHAEAHGELGAVLVAEERAAEAIPHLEAAIGSKPDLWPAYPQLGRAYAIQKKYKRAEEVLREALAHDSDGSAHYQLGVVLRDEGKSTQAAQLFAEVKAIKREQLALDNISNAISPGEKQ